MQHPDSHSPRPAANTPQGFLTPEPLGHIVYGSHRRVMMRLSGLGATTRHLQPAVDLLERVGVDFQRWKRINVTGSKGKGSTSAMIANLLTGMGEKVGFVSSPHLRHFNERIRIDGACVPYERVEAMALEIEPLVAEIDAGLEGDAYLGPSGVILTIAARLFAEAGVTAIVVEAGRGGEFDEARLIDAQVSVLTPVMLEHPDKLGSTVAGIARTKARIAAPGSVIVTGRQVDEAAIEIEAVAADLDATLVRVDPDETVRRGHGSTFDLTIGSRHYRQISMPVFGHRQAENAAVAVSAVRELFGTELDDRIVRESLAATWLPGRASIIANRPAILVDGAINAESAQVTVEYLQAARPRRVTAVVAVPAPKDLSGLVRVIAPHVDRIVLTEVATPTLRWYPDAAAMAREYAGDVVHEPDLAAALALGMAGLGDEDALLLLGTQSFVGAVLDAWNVDTCTVRRPG